MPDPAIPEWRRGAVYWRPLIDGREITVYPQISLDGDVLGAEGGLLALGPLADSFGYDQGWQYTGVEECLYEARRFDGEGDPGGGWTKATGAGDHGQRIERRQFEVLIPSSEGGQRVFRFKTTETDITKHFVLAYLREFPPPPGVEPRELLARLLDAWRKRSGKDTEAPPVVNELVTPREGDEVTRVTLVGERVGRMLIDRPTKGGFLQIEGIEETDADGKTQCRVTGVAKNARPFTPELDRPEKPNEPNQRRRLK